jgi:hypothetical protein
MDFAGVRDSHRERTTSSSQGSCSEKYWQANGKKMEAASVDSSHEKMDGRNEKTKKIISYFEVDNIKNVSSKLTKRFQTVARIHDTVSTHVSSHKVGVQAAARAFVFHDKKNHDVECNTCV